MPTRLPVVPLAMAGIIGPIWFTTLVIAQGMLQPDYSHIEMPISALAAWPAGWVQNLNFFVFATLMAAFAVALHHAIRPTRLGMAGIVLSLVSCAGLFLVGLFPWIDLNGVPTETRGHVVGSVLVFLGASTGLMVLSRRMAVDLRWQDLSAYVLWSGVVMLILFIVVGGFALERGAPLHRWVGLLQRALVAVWFACILVMARRAVRLTRENVSASATVAG